MTKRLIEAAMVLALLAPPAASVGSSLLAPPAASAGSSLLTPPAAATSSTLGQATLAARRVRETAIEMGFAPLSPPPAVRPELVELGRMLAFDPELSGNRDIACMTCHSPHHGTGDGLRLSIGTGGSGLGPSRQVAGGVTIGRNSPALFNLHASQPLFLDGRVALGDDGYHTPARETLTDEMTATFEFGALSALPLFPVLARDEMRGFGGNELAALPSDDPRSIWDALMDRLRAIPGYVRLFESAYPGIAMEDMTFAHAANAIAGFLVSDLSFIGSPWDAFLAGDLGALTLAQLDGADRFLELACSECHSGPALTDGEFHNVALAQVGPGLGDGPDGRDDYGRFRVTGDPDQRYAFRTPALRNVELTAPYGHAGQFADLSDFVAHYGDSADKLRGYGGELPAGLAPLDNEDAILATRDPLLDGVELSPETVAQLTEFMRALTDPAARELSSLVPRAVPSGLPVAGVGTTGASGAPGSAEDVAAAFAGGR